MKWVTYVLWVNMYMICVKKKNKKKLIENPFVDNGRQTEMGR